MLVNGIITQIRSNIHTEICLSEVYMNQVGLHMFLIFIIFFILCVLFVKQGTEICSSNGCKIFKMLPKTVQK
jgi:hypothetical protein